MGAGDSSEVDDLADEIGKKLGVSDDVDQKDNKKKSDKGSIALQDIPASPELRQVAKWIQEGKVKRIVVLSGAGVSVAAGIPDFRSPGTGLYDNLQKYNLPHPEAVFELNFYTRNPQPFCALAKEIWPGLTHSPTLTHSFLKLLSDRGLLLRNYSQNIDGLEFLAGIPSEQIVECHGHFRTASCTKCGTKADGDAVKTAIVDKGEAPTCVKCKKYVKPDIVFFGESLPDRFHKLLRGDVEQADLLLVMGTSLQVAPVSMIPNMVNCFRALFNRDLVMRVRKQKDVFVQGDCDTNVELLCDLLGWKGELLEQNEKTRVRDPDVPKKAKG
jgi:NAD-dependent SIR2 family protein deacetylase